MYIYYNNQGVLTTSIPHGEPVRQGNSLNLYICLPVEFFSRRQENRTNWSMYVTTILPGGILGVVSLETLTEDNEVIKTFTKTNDSEVTYDLKDKFPYSIYYFKLKPEQSTIHSGVLQIKVTLARRSNYNETISLGHATVFVEKVLENNSQKANAYVELVRQIRDMDSKKEDKKNKTAEWGDEPSDIKYPTEKLVKDYVDSTNQDTYDDLDQKIGDLSGDVTEMNINITNRIDQVENIAKNKEEIFYGEEEPDTEDYLTWVVDANDSEIADILSQLNNSWNTNSLSQPDLSQPAQQPIINSLVAPDNLESPDVNTLVSNDNEQNTFFVEDNSLNEEEINTLVAEDNMVEEFNNISSDDNANNTLVAEDNDGQETINTITAD